MPIEKHVKKGINSLKSRMRSGTLDVTDSEMEAIGGFSEFHSIATGFLKDAHENMDRSCRISEMLMELPPEIRAILPNRLKLEAAEQSAKCQAWMTHAEGYLYDDTVIESEIGVTDSIDDNVSSLIDRAKQRKKSEVSEASAKNNVVRFPVYPV